MTTPGQPRAIPQGEDVGMHSLTCLRINQRLLRAYGSYAIPLGIKEGSLTSPRAREDSRND